MGKKTNQSILQWHEFAYILIGTSCGISLGFIFTDENIIKNTNDALVWMLLFCAIGSFLQMYTRKRLFMDSSKGRLPR